MTTPIIVHHRHDTVEAMQFTGTAESAHDLYEFIGGGRPAASIRYTAALNEVSVLELFTRHDDGYELTSGDWLIKEDGLFSVCRWKDFPLRYATAIEKIKLEAGMN